MCALFAIAQDGLVDYVRFYAVALVTRMLRFAEHTLHELIIILRHTSQSNITYRCRRH